MRFIAVPENIRTVFRLYRIQVKIKYRCGNNAKFFQCEIKYPDIRSVIVFFDNAVVIYADP